MQASAVDRNEILKTHRALLQALQADGGEFDPSTVEPIRPPATKANVADDPSKSFVADSRGRRIGVLILSNPVSPRLVGRSVDRANEAKRRLTAELGSVVLEPIVADTFRGLSYAIWPIQRSLSSSRVLRWLQKRYIRPRALSWLRLAAQHTMCLGIATNALETAFLAPLSQLADDDRFSDEMRNGATDGLERISSREWLPVTILQHSDLWLGNFLLPRDKNCTKRNHYGFFIIDWAGATLSGHPFFDLLRFGMSSGATLKHLRSEILAHCDIVHCEIQDVVPYLLAALGTIGMNLEHFPEPRYLAMCRNVFSHAVATLDVA